MLEKEVRLRTEELALMNAELGETNDELAETNERLINSNEELAQYAYVASHDLQEPLRKILIFSEVLCNHTGLSEEDSRLVRKISQSSQRMSLLIRDLLEFSRLLNSEKLMRPVKLSQVIAAVVNDFEITIAEKNAVIEIGELPVIEAVNLQMNQLFYNLMSNSLKFTNPDKAPRIKISSRILTADEVADNLQKPNQQFVSHEITFTDNGIGFESKYSEQIFEVFKRLHGREIYPGSGIGLALCRRIVSNHNGHLFVNSEPDSGTSFHIILPEKQHEIQSALPENFNLLTVSNLK
jgi:light-regulated signal transduction histidine kinase (bacteriophytochrome)